jgi:hypothetical protein
MRTLLLAKYSCRKERDVLYVNWVYGRQDERRWSCTRRAHGFADVRGLLKPLCIDGWKSGTKTSVRPTKGLNEATLH